MRRMLWRTTLLIVWLTVVFNIERLDFDNGATVNLTSFFYALVAATVILLLWLPLRRRQLYLIVVGIVAFHGMVRMLLPTPLFDGIQKYLTFTEITALLVTAGLTWWLSQVLRDFEQAIEAISLPKRYSRVLSYKKLNKRINAEMGRARRHQKPLSVAMIALDPTTFNAALHQATQDVQAAMIARYVRVRVGVFLARHVRESDVVAHHDKNGVFLLLAPESQAEQTHNMLKRLASEVENEMHIRMRYSIADFPNTALTAEELLHRVKQDLQLSSDPATMLAVQSEENTIIPDRDMGMDYRTDDVRPVAQGETK